MSNTSATVRQDFDRAARAFADVARSRGRGQGVLLALTGRRPLPAGSSVL